MVGVNWCIGVDVGKCDQVEIIFGQVSAGNSVLTDHIKNSSDEKFPLSQKWSVDVVKGENKGENKITIGGVNEPMPLLEGRGILGKAKIKKI